MKFKVWLVGKGKKEVMYKSPPGALEVKSIDLKKKRAVFKIG